MGLSLRGCRDAAAEDATWLTEVMPLVLSVLVDVFPRKAAKEDAVETGMESVQVGTTHVTDARLGLERETSNKGYLVREASAAEDNAHLQWTMAKQTEPYSLPA